MDELIRSKLFDKHGITGLFSTRIGGVSPAPFDSLNFGDMCGDNQGHIDTNLQRLMQTAQLASVPHQAQQVHGNDLLWCKGDGHMHRKQADILASDQCGTAVAVRTADCLPVLLADPDVGLVAAAHAGWRGTARQVVMKAVEALCAKGAVTERIIASLGPCIGPCCFGIGDEAADALLASANESQQYVRGKDQLFADLAGINRQQLLENGLLASQIESLSECTCCNRRRFFSYRRDGDKSGRMLAVVAARPST